MKKYQNLFSQEKEFMLFFPSEKKSFGFSASEKKFVIVLRVKNESLVWFPQLKILLKKTKIMFLAETRTEKIAAC